MRLFKVVNEDGSAFHGGTGHWPLPKDDAPGKWKRKLCGPLIPCKHGYHVVTLAQLPAWLGPAIFDVEINPGLVSIGVFDDDGNLVGTRQEENLLVCPDKIVARKGRLVRRLPWDEQSARLFAADCAEHVLPIFEREHPDDDSPRRTLEAARAYARGEIDRDTLVAARSAARPAVWSLAAETARSAAWDAVAEAAWCAARSALWSATRGAARGAARDAAWDAEVAWQAERLAHYLGVEAPS